MGMKTNKKIAQNQANENKIIQQKVPYVVLYISAIINNE